MSLRLKYVLCFIGTIILGLFSRSSMLDFPQFIDDNLGDILWGSMVYFLFSIFITDHRPLWKVGYATLFSFSVEFSQLITAEWIETLRNFPGMRLVLGYGFKFSDLVCYTIGIFIALLFEKQFINKNQLFHSRDSFLH